MSVLSRKLVRRSLVTCRRRGPRLIAHRRILKRALGKVGVNLQADRAHGEIVEHIEEPEMVLNQSAVINPQSSLTAS